MSKRERVAKFLGGFEDSGAYAAGYVAFFECFHAGEYYEAHDVLEQVWLGSRDENAPFYKGLIQIAGAFVHLRKNFEHPEHPKHRHRLHPAVRLFELGMKNIRPFGPCHLGLNVDAAVALGESLVVRIRGSEFSQNPWSPSHRPQLICEVRRG